jgi:alanine racemase
MDVRKRSASVAEIDLSALRHNLQQIKKRIGRREILAVVKANAYGHGAVPIARLLAGGKRSWDISLLGVAYLEEAIQLRKAGITDPILLMTGCPIEQIPEIVRYQLTPLLFDTASLLALNRYAVRRGKRVNIHVKLDTGMGRLGLPVSEALPFIQMATEQEGIRVEGILTHFAEADLKDLSFARKQFEALKQIWTALQKAKTKIRYCHLANSAAIMHFGAAHFNLVRPGLMLYGYSPLEEESQIPLKPILQLRARVIALKKVPAGTSISYGRTFFTRRESLIATVSIGYADGYPRLLSNRGVMIAKGRRVPVVGRICMDMTMLDVTEAPPLNVGDWVTVIGEEGGEAIWADELARLAETIPYEILCGIGERVLRIYSGDRG